MNTQQLWVEPVGGIIMARMRGTLTEPMLAECQERVVSLAHDTGLSSVLYDALELEAPSLDLIVMQQQVLETEPVALRRALVVPNTRLAYLARLAFGEGDHRVFYNDIAGACRWLQETL
jgi:hypothetical protein